MFKQMNINKLTVLVTILTLFCLEKKYVQPMSIGNRLHCGFQFLSKN